jgi:hypothetical protein
MPYSTQADVRKIISSGMSDSDITALIVQSDADLDDRLQGAPMSTTLKLKCSVYLTAAQSETQTDPNILTQNRTSTGESRIGFWLGEVERMVKLARQADLQFWVVADVLGE